MKNRISLLPILVSAALCAAQTTSGTRPAEDQNQTPGPWPLTEPSTRSSGALPGPEQRFYSDPLADRSAAPTSEKVGPERLSPTFRKPILNRSEFELFAEDAAGRPLDVYGRPLFEQVASTFAPMDRVPVPASYVMGAGDELIIRVWGKVELQTRVTVDRNGQIFLPKIGALTVAGIRYDQLDAYLHSAIANQYKDFQLNVTMGQLRSIQIFVLGNARQPGVYTVSSMSTLLTALFASGGPSATGTMRRIELRRGGATITVFDIYDMLRNGDKSHDAPLLPGDVIFIPAVGPQTAVIGSVLEPGIYELAGNETVASILKNAGGLSNLASVNRALLERVEDHRRRSVDEFALDQEGLGRPLKDGDILRVFPISPRFDNAVTLRGNVAQPGRFLWHEGMRISDLIPTRDVLLTRDYWNQQNFLASALPPESPNAQPIASEGTLNLPDSVVGARSEARLQTSQGYGLRQATSDSPLAEPGAMVTGTTANYRPQTRERWDRPRPRRDVPNHDVMTDVTEAGTEINWEYAAIERRDETDLTTRIIAFNLENAIDRPSSADNQMLRAGDVVTIFSRRDIPLPQDKHAAFVRVGGEVNAPGVYRIETGETLRQLVERAGGLTSHSYLYASQLTRESTRKAQEEELKVSAAQMQRDLASRYASAQSLAPGNATDQQAQFSIQQALLTQLSEVHPVGRIILDMKPTAGSIADIPDIPLEDGDSYVIPSRLGTVQVSGAVYNANAFRYEDRKRVSTYLKAAGGPTRQADVKRAFLIRADGTVVSRQSRGGTWGNSFESLKLLPGDAIVVPTKMKSPNGFMQQLPFISAILSQSAATAAIVGTR